MRFFITMGVIALALGGCQTTEQSLYSAEAVCAEAGMRPGTQSYQRCVNANYRQNVANSNATANAVAVGAAAGLLGGAVIAANSRPYYGGYYRPYRSYGGYCNRWRCY
jgi:hypothetical protein